MLESLEVRVKHHLWMRQPFVRGSWMPRGWVQFLQRIDCGLSSSLFSSTDSYKVLVLHREEKGYQRVRRKGM